MVIKCGSLATTSHNNDIIKENGDYSIFYIFSTQLFRSTDSPGVQTIPDWIQYQRVNTEILRISISDGTNYESKLKKYSKS